LVELDAGLGLDGLATSLNRRACPAPAQAVMVTVGRAAVSSAPLGRILEQTTGASAGLGLDPGP
jgi:hypothetical protein